MAVTASQVIRRQDGCRLSIPAAVAFLYEGTLAFLNASGYADDNIASGVNQFAGIVVKDCDNSGGSAGDRSVEVYRDGVFKLSGSGFTQASVGRRVYATDNYTLTLTAAGNCYVGRIVGYVSSSEVLVELDVRGHANQPASVTATGSAQGDAAALTGKVNIVAASDGTKGVILPADIPPGDVIEVYNSVATSGLKVYPATGDDINDGTTNAAIVMEGKTLARFVRLDSTTWAAQFTLDT